MPTGVVHGPLAFRARHRGRDYLNPTLVLRRGERVRATLANRIDTPTIVHWHGLAVDARNDGNGLYTVAPGQTYDYDFEVRDRGRCTGITRILTASRRARLMAVCSA